MNSEPKYQQKVQTLFHFADRKVGNPGSRKLSWVVKLPFSEGYWIPTSRDPVGVLNYSWVVNYLSLGILAHLLRMVSWSLNTTCVSFRCRWWSTSQSIILWRQGEPGSLGPCSSRESLKKGSSHLANGLWNKSLNGLFSLLYKYGCFQK